MSTTEVSGLIAAMRSGELTLQQLADAFRARRWPTRTVPDPTSYMEQAAAAQADPDVDLPGSFDEVTAAYDRGELTSAEYEVLSDAVTESINAEHDGAERGAAE
jgi:hypothetical protein